MNPSIYDKLESFCITNGLFCFNELKKVIQREKQLIEINPKYASIFYVKLERFGKILKDFKEQYPLYYNFIRHGDILVAIDEDEREDSFFIYKKDNDVKLINWDYDNVPQEFDVFGGEFSIHYWDRINQINKQINNFSSFDNPEYGVEVSLLNIPEMYRKRYKPLTLQLKNRLSIDIIDDIDVEEFIYFRVKNKMYIFHDDDEFEEIESIYITNTISVDVPSRWNIIKACTKLLSLHKRAVVSANTPERKLQRGEFEL
jgi:hypothetical protein